MFEKLAKGPRQRTDRVVRTLKNVEGVDIYRVVLLALAKMKPGVQTVEYEELRGYIKEIVATSFSQAHEVSRVMEEMAKIAAKEQGAVPVIEWEKEYRKLHRTDPFSHFTFAGDKIKRFYHFLSIIRGSAHANFDPRLHLS